MHLSHDPCSLAPPRGIGLAAEAAHSARGFALRHLAPDQLQDPEIRAACYRAAGLTASPAEDDEAVRRVRTYWQHMRPALAAALEAFVAGRRACAGLAGGADAR